MKISQLKSLLPSTTIHDSASIDRPSESGFYRRFYPVAVNGEVGVLIVRISWGVAWTGDNEIADSFEWIRDAAADWAFPPSNAHVVKGYASPVTAAVFSRVIEGFEEDLGGPISKAITHPSWHGWSLEYCEAINSIRMSKHSKFESCKRDWFSMRLANAIGLRDYPLGVKYAVVKADGASTPLGALEEYSSMAGLRSLELSESMYGIPGRTLFVFEADSLVMTSWGAGTVDLTVYQALEKKLILQFGEGEPRQDKEVIANSWSTDRTFRYLLYTTQGKELMLGSGYHDFKDRYDERMPAMSREIREQEEARQRELDSLYRR